MFAARVGDLESATLLVAAGAERPTTPMPGASAPRCWRRMPATASWWSFCSIAAPTPNAAAAGFAALHAAIMRRDDKLVRVLIAHGADPNAPARGPGRRRAARRTISISVPNWSARRRSGWPPVSPSRRSCGCWSSTAPIRALVHQADHRGRGSAPGTASAQIDVTTALMAAAGMGGGTAWVAAPQRAARPVARGRERRPSNLAPT